MRRRTFLLALALATTALPPTRAAADGGVAEPAPRPRIGLVLGGGGAKGAAHVGVLRVLEEMRIPVDCIVGTSMGALVGGTYATGMSADELEQAVRRDIVAGRDRVRGPARQGRRCAASCRRSPTATAWSSACRTGGSRRLPA